MSTTSASLQAFTRGAPIAQASALSAPASNARVLEQLQAIHPATLADLNRERTCATCTLKYRERDNIGQWACYFHVYSFDRDEGRWRCCGRELNTCGCRRCDHEEKPHVVNRKAVEVPRWADAWIVAPRAETVADSYVTDAWEMWDIRSRADRQTDVEEARYRAWVAPRRRMVARADYMIRK